MTTHVPRLPFSLDPLIAEAKRRMRRRRLLLLAAVLIAIATAASVIAALSPGGPGSGPPNGGGALSARARVGAVRIDPAGAVGPLHVNRSGRAQVIAWAGLPDVDRHGGNYEVLAYGCPSGVATKKDWSEYLVPCRTSFYLVGGRLSLFFTQDRRFAEAAGVRIGTPTKQAESLLHRRAFASCTDAISLRNEHAWLTVSLGGGRPQPDGTTNRLVGGRVDGFYLLGRRNPRVTDCA
jgi:hypothetical protein